MKTLAIDMSAWLALSRETGACVSVSFQVATGSMQPLIRPGIDTVTICPVNKPLKIGDIVLLERTGESTLLTEYCLHRIFGLCGDTVITKGDNCDAPDMPVSVASVIGIAVSINKNGKIIRLDTKKNRSPLLIKRRLRKIAGRCVNMCRKTP